MLFLEFLPSPVCCSLLVRTIGRTEDAVIVRSAAEGVGGLAGGGSFLVVVDGEGDDVEAEAPFVWVPGRAGRFILVAPFCCVPPEPVTGAMMMMRA